jgi:hypothetical protein
MTTFETKPGLAPIALTPTTSEAATVAHCLSLILAGKPLPPELRPATPTSRPSTVEEGLESIVMGAF